MKQRASHRAIRRCSFSLHGSPAIACLVVTLVWTAAAAEYKEAVGDADMGDDRETTAGGGAGSESTNGVSGVAKAASELVAVDEEVISAERRTRQQSHVREHSVSKHAARSLSQQKTEVGPCPHCYRIDCRSYTGEK
ncbi:hypothetical protein CSUI_000175 [Cystoisospora suis]|uniref:Transmembrane protein n=1 Tax=Cystoisospora suis TaxID=483139 RepID=A0A2C6LIG5_9APIC|nr:hypothetical protein CSUI_000175 [Cystoisospora suis]